MARLTLTIVLGVAAAILVAADRGTASSLTACRASQLRAHLEVQGATSHLLGLVRFVNRGSAACTLRGRPATSLANARGRSLPSSTGTLPPLWRYDGQGRPPGWPVVTVRPRTTAITVIELGNWCGRLHARVLVRFRLRRDPGVISGAVRMGGSCLAPHHPPAVSIGPFEPAPA